MQSIGFARAQLGGSPARLPDRASHTLARQRSSRGPSFFLVGAPKAGTTAMNFYLAAHPDIFMAPKELHYFSGEVLFGPPTEERGLAWYLDAFGAAGEKRLLGEASVFYLSSEHAGARIKAFAPDARILIHVRNPSDFLVSYHSEMLFLGFEDIEDVEQALDAEAERREGRSIPAECRIPRLLHYSDIARVSRQIEHVFAVFGRQNVLVNVFDDLVANPAALYRGTVAFLGADPSFAPNFEAMNGNKVVRSQALRCFLNAPPQPLKDVAKLLLATPIRRAILGPIWRMNTRYVSRPEPNPALRARLKRAFAGEVRRLSDLLDRDLSAWSR
jgi:hypothetical protein